MNYDNQDVGGVVGWTRKSRVPVIRDEFSHFFANRRSLDEGSSYIQEILNREQNDLNGFERRILRNKKGLGIWGYFYATVMNKKLKTTHRKCVCDPLEVVKKITGHPKPLRDYELNNIRLALHTERNSDSTLHLILRGKDIYDRYEQRIEDSDVHAICRHIRQNPHRITKLDLCYNHITDVGFQKLVHKCLIKGRSSLIDLNIMNNNLTEKSMLLLKTYAEVINLRYLRINGNKISTQGGIYYALFLKNNKSLQFTDIAETDMNLSSIVATISSLRFDGGRNRTLKVLDCSRIIPLFNHYAYESKWLAYHMEYLLERNNTIIELHLQKNQFIAHDMEYLVRGLRNNSSLKYLDLGYNRFGNYGVEVLAEYFQSGSSNLVFLNLAGNGIGDVGARALSFGLPFTKIIAIDLGHNKFTDEGIVDILNTIKKKDFTRFLNLWGNEIGPKSCQIMERMFLAGVLFQQTCDVLIYEWEKELRAAYYPNPADRNKHFYYCEMEYGYAQPILQVKRNVVESFEPPPKMDCKHRRKLRKTDAVDF